MLFLTIDRLQGQVFKDPPSPLKPATIEKIFTAFSKIFAVDRTDKFWILEKDDKSWVVAKRTIVLIIGCGIIGTKTELKLLTVQLQKIIFR